MNPHPSKPGREIVPARKLKGRIAAVLRAEGGHFVSRPVDSIAVGYDGIAGDHHAGLTRASGSREPWYERGTPMRNERQLSILSVEELAQIADNLGIARLEPGWIGANLVLEGISDLTFLPPRSLLFFESGATLRVDGHNGPCPISGGEVARAIGAARTGGPLAGEPEDGFDWTRTDIALRFVQAAYMKRGLVAWVEREGEIRPGAEVSVRIWEQWIY